MAARLAKPARTQDGAQHRHICCAIKAHTIYETV